jgi:hypothetical protein
MAEQSEHIPTWWKSDENVLVWLEVCYVDVWLRIYDQRVDGPFLKNPEGIKDVSTKVMGLYSEHIEKPPRGLELGDILERVYNGESVYLNREDGGTFAMITGYIENGNPEVAEAIKNSTAEEKILYVVRSLDLAGEGVSLESNPDADPGGCVRELESKLRSYIVRDGLSQKAGTETRTFLSNDESTALEFALFMVPEAARYITSRPNLKFDRDSSKEHTPEVEQSQEQSADLTANASSQHEELPASEKVLGSAQDPGSKKADEAEQVVRFYAIINPDLEVLGAVTITKVIVVGNAIRYPTSIWRIGGSDL